MKLCFGICRFKMNFENGIFSHLSAQDGPSTVSGAQWEYRIVLAGVWGPLRMMMATVLILN